jgi:hypothetical protein
MWLSSASRTERWLVALALAALFALSLLAVGVLGVGLGVRYGVVLGPNLNIDLGLVRLVASTNPAPDCNPADPVCAAQRLRADSPAPRFYSVWVVTKQKVVTPSGGPEQYGGVRVLAVQSGP